MKLWGSLLKPFLEPNGIHDERLEELEKTLRKHEKERDDALRKLTAAIDEMKRQDAQRNA